MINEVSAHCPSELWAVISWKGDRGGSLKLWQSRSAFRISWTGRATSPSWGVWKSILTAARSPEKFGSFLDEASSFVRVPPVVLGRVSNESSLRLRRCARILGLLDDGWSITCGSLCRHHLVLQYRDPRSKSNYAPWLDLEPSTARVLDVDDIKPSQQAPTTCREGSSICDQKAYRKSMNPVSARHRIRVLSASFHEAWQPSFPARRAARSTRGETRAPGGRARCYSRAGRSAMLV